jgi:aerobic-type carbon monoxide dehydrogenase small subunit (CoxS/CutS family)
MSGVAATEVHVRLNGEPVTLHVREDEPLLEALRTVGMNSVRESCALGVCGTCTVLCDGVPISSCLSWAALAEGVEIRTAEGLADGETLDPLQQAFIDTGGFQCGYCTPGMLMMARDLLDRVANPSVEQIRAHLSGNICRCGCYPEIIAAVRQAAAGSRAEQA